MILQELNVKIGLLLDEFQKQATQVKEEAKKIEGTFSDLKKALVALGVFSFAKAGVAEFMKDERELNRFQFTLRKLGEDWQSASAEALSYTENAEKITGFYSRDMIPIINKLTKITGNYREALALMPDILDITASGTMDMNSAMEAVGRAFIGDQRGLGMLAIQFGIARRDAKDFSNIIEEVRKRVEGQASAQKGTARDLMNFSNAYKDFSQNVGISLSSVIHFGSEILQVGLPIIQTIDNVQKAQNKIIAAPVEFISKRISEWLGIAHRARTESEKMIDELIKSGRDLSKREPLFEEKRPTVGRISKEEQMTRLANAEKIAKMEYEMNRDYSEKYLALMKNNTAKIATLYGKESLEYKEHMAAERKVAQDLTKYKLNMADMEMDNLLAIGRKTDAQRLEQMRRNLEEIKKIWGEESEEYQGYLGKVIEATNKNYSFMIQTMQGAMSGITQGFAEMFMAITEEGAMASQALEAFAKGFARSVLNAVASAIDAYVLEGTALYLKWMLFGGPIAGAASSAYSLPILAALSATSGAIHGLAAMMAEGGVMTKAGLYMMAEKPTGEPEAAIPFTRMDEAFEKYSNFLKRRSGETATQQIIVNQDNRGAYFGDSGFAEARLTKKIGDSLLKRGVIKK